MKKFAFLLLSFCFCFLFVFGGCSNNLLSECQKHISDERQNYFWGESDNFYVSFSSGTRESPYALDGIPNKSVEFGIITISPKKHKATQKLAYELNVNNQKFSGEFEQSPFDDTYASDINKMVDSNATVVVSITDGGTTEQATLECVSKNFNITSQNALEIALEQVKNELQEFSSKQNFEIHLKIVADINQNVSDKFWLVMFLGEDGKNITVLINPTTGECETKKV